MKPEEVRAKLGELAEAMDTEWIRRRQEEQVGIRQLPNFLVRAQSGSDQSLVFTQVF